MTMAPKKYDPDFLLSQVIDDELNEEYVKHIDLKAEIEQERQSNKAYRETFDLLRDTTILARQLRHLREKRGLTQAQVADLAGTSQQVVSRLERPDYTGHSLSMLRRVVGALGGNLIVRISANNEAISSP